MAEWILLLLQQVLKVSAVHLHTCEKMPLPTQRINCIVNEIDVLVHSKPNVQQTLLSLFMIFNCLNAYY